MKERTYIAIDLKSFYASVECRERGLDPMDTNLVVADESRTDKTICLAVTPSLVKAQINFSVASCHTYLPSCVIGVWGVPPRIIAVKRRCLLRYLFSHYYYGEHPAFSQTYKNMIFSVQLDIAKQK